jgi:xylan 1,4-beta-xylosidase
MLSNLGNKKEIKESRIKLPENTSVTLRVTIDHKDLQFWYSLDKKEWFKIGSILDATILSDEYGGQKFTGTYVGIFCQDLYTKHKIAYFENFAYQDF